MANDPLAFLDTPSEASQSTQSSDPLSFLTQGPSRTRSLLSAFPKGAFKGGHSLGKLTDPLAFFTGSDIEPMQAQALEQTLPTQKGRFAEGALETAGEMAPSFALGPESLLVKAGQVGAGAFAKQALKESGASELAQEIGSGVASLSPQAIKGMFGKRIIPSKAQKAAYGLLKEHGFDDKQIAPFLKDKKKSGILAKWGAPFMKGEKLSKDLSSIGESLYGSIQEKGKDLEPLTGLRKTAFRQQFANKMEKIPYFHKELIQNDVARLLEGDVTWGKLRDFEVAVNNKIKATEGGKAVLGTLKEPVNFAERMMSPQLFKEKQIANEIYSSGKKFLKTIKPSNLSSLVKMGEFGGLVYSLLSGNPLAAKGILAKKASQFAVAKYLTNPRFLGMRKKLLQAVSKDNTSAVLNMTVKILEDLDRSGGGHERPDNDSDSD